MLEHKINKPSEALNYFSPVTEFSIGIPINKDIKNLRYGFTVGDIGIIMDKKLPSEIVKGMSICAIPNTPVWFSGVVNIRSNLIPIFDLHAVFKEGEQSDLQSPILVIGKGYEAMGVLIEAPPRPLEILETSTSPASIPLSLERYIDNTYVDNGLTWLEINFVGFFSALSKQLI